ncbi:NADH:ubiquinone oxidoreductase subunit L [compost metagenome]
MRPLIGFSRWGLWRFVDETVIDGAVNGSAKIYALIAQGVRFLQNGLVRYYAYAVLLGVVGILTYVVFRFQLLRF